MPNVTTFATTYGAWTAWPCTIASLVTSATLVAGKQSDVVTVTLDDLQVSGSIVCGTSPTAGGIIQVFAWGKQDGSAYPDQMGASDANRSVTSVNVKNAGWLKLLMSASVDNTTDRAYQFFCGSLKALFGGRLPEVVGLWVVHSTGVNLKSTLQALNYRTVTETATTT